MEVKLAALFRKMYQTDQTTDQPTDGQNRPKESFTSIEMNYNYFIQIRIQEMGLIQPDLDLKT